jgi:uncharacterized protein YutE (UPF0331/DUF86 family)
VLPDKTKEKIDFEFEEIESLFELYKKELFDLKEKPSLFELTAFAGILHSFYNGIEKILLIIASDIDKKTPADSEWHKSLLLQMTKKNETRDAVLSEEIKDQLLDYLGFRHFFRHSYSFHLEWEEMEDLVKTIREVWKKFKEKILAFMES